MAMDPLVEELAVYDLDIAQTPAEGVATDLTHLERRCVTKAYALEKTEKPVDKLGECLKDCKLVLAPVGVPKKPGQSAEELLKVNAGIAKSIVEACSKHCPEAIVGLNINPVNSVVAAMASMYEKKGLNPNRILGITTIDVVRANKFLHLETHAPVDKINVPVVGGGAAETCVPLFSQEAAAKKLDKATIEKLHNQVRNAPLEVEKAKLQRGSSTLAMAYAGARFGHAVLAGFAGQVSTEYAYLKVAQPIEGLSCFATQVSFGKDGVQKVNGIGKLSEFETERLAAIKEQLGAEIQAGLNFADDKAKR